MKDFVVIYHADCVDGFTAAWLAHQVFGEAADYLPYRYGDAPPEFHGNEKVYILDFSFPRDVLLKIKEEIQHLIVLDHHKTAEENLRGLDFCVFDPDKCGAHLTWDQFHSGVAPVLLAYVEDRDLWKWRLPDSKEISAAIQSYDFTWKNWDQLASWLADTMQKQNVISQGEAILRYQEQSIQKHMSQAHHCQVGDHVVPVVCCSDKAIVSELGHRLAVGESFSVSYNDDAVSMYRTWSLRSTDVGMDVSLIAKSFGGGGHKNAAGFRTQMSSKEVRKLQDVGSGTKTR